MSAIGREVAQVRQLADDASVRRRVLSDQIEVRPDGTIDLLAPAGVLVNGGAHPRDELLIELLRQGYERFVLGVEHLVEGAARRLGETDDVSHRRFPVSTLGDRLLQGGEKSRAECGGGRDPAGGHVRLAAGTGSDHALMLDPPDAARTACRPRAGRVVNEM
jgi:hypothetical protein